MPTACFMEDLSGRCRALLGKLLLIDGFVGTPWLSPKALLCRKSLVWLIDKAIREYNLARSSLLAELEQEKQSYEELLNADHRLEYMFAFTDHMENCVLTCRRIFRSLEALKNDRTIAPMERVTRKLIESNEKQITPLRNELEHMGGILASGNIPDGQTLTVVLTNDDKSIQVGSFSLSFDQLASTLKGLHSIVEGLFNNPGASNIS